MEKINQRKFWVTEELLASKEKRFLNFIIDRAFLYVLLFLLGVFLYALAEVIQNDSFTSFVTGLEDINPLVDMLIGIIFYTLYYTILESTWQISIGKLITKTKVVQENGDKPKDETILLRSLSRLIPFEIFSFLGNSPRGWHDSLTNTYVVDKKIFEEHKKNFENFELIGLDENN